MGFGDWWKIIVSEEHSTPLLLSYQQLYRDFAVLVLLADSYKTRSSPLLMCLLLCFHRLKYFP